MKVKILIVTAILFALSCTKNTNTSQCTISNENLKEVLIAFQENQVPKKDKVILIELFGDVSRGVYEIRKIEYPHLFDERCHYYVLELNSTYFFVNPQFSYDINISLDTARVKKIINEVYATYLSQEMYEVKFDDLHSSWYYVSGEPPRVFNMKDSVAKYGNIEEQYNRLNNFIDKNKYPEIDSLEIFGLK